MWCSRTPAVHHQAEDRAHRIGQTEEVKVVYFILDDPHSTDRQIYSLLEAKELTSRQALSSALVAELIDPAGNVYSIQAARDQATEAV